MTPSACDLCPHFTDGKAEGGYPPLGLSLGKGAGAAGPQATPVETSCRSSHHEAFSLPGLKVSTWETPGPGPKPGPAPDPSEPRPLHTAGGPPALFCLVNSCGQVAVPGLDGPPGLLAYEVGSLASRVQGNPLPGVPRLETSVCGLGSHLPWSAVAHEPGFPKASRCRRWALAKPCSPPRTQIGRAHV